MTSKARGPLDGIRVVDLTSVMLGPFCTQILGDMGADVIKVEPPHGDIGRFTGAAKNRGMSAAYLAKSRNKRSVALDLKHPEGREALAAITATADVFVHNIRPKAAARLAIDYESISALKPDIVYASATGFGEAGPYVDKPAYDDLIQGASGLASLFGQVTGEPRYGPSVLADKTTGLYLTYSITMGLLHKERTGEGQKIHVPMYEAFSAFVMSEHMQGQTFEPATSPAGYQRMLTPHRKPYATSDGYVCVLPYNDKHWGKFFTLIGQPELANDVRFSDQSARSANIDALYAIVAEAIKTRTSNDWLKTLEDADIPVMPMNAPDDLFDCPHMQAVDMFPLVDHPSEGELRHIKIPVSFSKTPGSIRKHAEKLGESTDDVLREVGYSDQTIAALHRDGVARRASDE